LKYSAALAMAAFSSGASTVPSVAST
jgi:hypothetical protein